MEFAVLPDFNDGRTDVDALLINRIDLQVEAGGDFVFRAKDHWKCEASESTLPNGARNRAQRQFARAAAWHHA